MGHVGSKIAGLRARTPDVLRLSFSERRPRRCMPAIYPRGNSRSWALTPFPPNSRSSRS